MSCIYQRLGTVVTQVDVFDYSEDSKDKQPVHNLHVFSDEEEENVVKE